MSRHNLHYWRTEEYLGIGAAAHSFLSGRRFYFPRDRAAFCRAENPWELTVEDGPGGGEEEKILLGLRLSEGIALSDFTPAAAERLKRKAEPLCNAGFLTLSEGRLSLTRRALPVSNSVIASLI